MNTRSIDGHGTESSAAVLHRPDSQVETVAFSTNRGRSEAISSYTAAVPWGNHTKILRAIAEQEAKTLLLRRAGLRAQASLFGGGGEGGWRRRRCCLRFMVEYCCVERVAARALLSKTACLMSHFRPPSPPYH